LYIYFNIKGKNICDDSVFITFQKREKFTEIDYTSQKRTRCKNSYHSLTTALINLSFTANQHNITGSTCINKINFTRFTTLITAEMHHSQLSCEKGPGNILIMISNKLSNAKVFAQSKHFTFRYLMLSSYTILNTYQRN